MRRPTELVFSKNRTEARFFLLNRNRTETKIRKPNSTIVDCVGILQARPGRPSLGAPLAAVHVQHPADPHSAVLGMQPAGERLKGAGSPHG